MQNLLKTRNQIFLITLIIGILGTLSLLFFNANYAISFLFGIAISLGYLWHLGYSVLKINANNKNIHSILRLSLTVIFMVLIGQVLTLNIIFICLGFLCNHLAMLIQVVFEIVRSRVGQSCK